MRDLLAVGRQILARQPFSTLLGAELLAGGEGRAEIRIPIRDDLTQHYGFVHGGVIGAAADTALTFAGGTVLGGSVVTAGFTINFLRPARGDFLVARGPRWFMAAGPRPSAAATCSCRRTAPSACARPRRARSPNSSPAPRKEKDRDDPPDVGAVGDCRARARRGARGPRSRKSRTRAAAFTAWSGAGSAPAVSWRSGPARGSG